MKKTIFTLLLFLAISLNAKSQFYETGQDPLSIKWKQIKTPNYKLIFPESFEKAAQNFAFSLDTIYPVIGKELQKHPGRISVVFHTQSSLSNGLVVYAPKRMELYTIPPQDNYAQDWITQLALHETRHVVQLKALDVGLTKLGSYLIGEQSVGVISSLVPRWFLEGDAVYSETEFSNSGRGRSAAFAMQYKALVMDKKLYNYEKALLGSYKHYVPDVYQMGYPMVKMARDTFYKDVFASSLRYTGRNPYFIFPFGRSMKLRHGYNNHSLYRLTYQELKKKWIEQDPPKVYKHWTTTKNRVYTDYNHPVVVNSQTIIAEKWSLKETRHFVKIDSSGEEKKLFSIGSNSGDRISFSGNKIIWSENRSDLRWQNRTYSEIVIFDINTKKFKRIKRNWYFSPVFSPDEKKIAAVKEDPGYKSSLVIIDAQSRKIISEINAPENTHLQHPVWLNHREIVCISVGKNGKSLVKLNDDEVWEQITPSSFQDISAFSIAGDFLLIAGERNGTNNIFSFNMMNGEFSQITFSRFGAFEPHFDANTEQLFFSEYTSDGYRIASVNWFPDTSLKKEPYFNIDETSHPHAISDFNLQKMTNDNRNYPVKSYSKTFNLFNFHSWLPLYYNYNITDFTNPAIYPGFTLLSQNLLGTMTSTLGYSYQEGHSHLHTQISYKALYPIISWSMDAGGPISLIGSNTAFEPKNSTSIKSTVNVSLPINLSKRNHVAGIVPYAEWKYNRNAYFIRTENRYAQEMNFINFGVNVYRYTRMAVRDIYPRLGFSSFFKMQTTPFEKNVYNSIYAASFRLYLPGLVKNHSTQIRYGYQYQSPLRYLYSSMFSFPPGYVTDRSEELHTLSSSYSLPLFYPDIHAGPLFYMKRIRANVFYDIAWNKYHRPGANIISRDILRSVGTDIIADVHFMRIMFPFQVGARFSYHPVEKEFFTQAIFSVNLVY